AVRPRVEYLAFELRAMINRDRLRQPAGLGQSIQHRLYARPSERRIDLDSHALPGAVVHYVEATKPSSGSQSVRHKVHRPTQVRRRRLRQRLPFHQADPLTLAPPHRQSGVAVDPINALAIDRPAFAAQPQIHAAIPVPAFERGNLLDSRPQCRAIGPSAAIPIQRPRNSHQPASACHAEVPFRQPPSDSFALRLRADHFRWSRSFRADLSSSASASRRLSLAFSCSSSFSRRASDTVIPAYFAFQL